MNKYVMVIPLILIFILFWHRKYLHICMRNIRSYDTVIHFAVVLESIWIASN